MKNTENQTARATGSFHVPFHGDPGVEVKLGGEESAFFKEVQNGNEQTAKRTAEGEQEVRQGRTT